jgi:hypothetical protein
MDGLYGQANATVTGKTIIIGLQPGTHSLIICARTLAGDISNSSVIYFTIQETENPLPQSFPAVTVAVLIVAVVSAVGFVIVSKRKG